MFRIRVSENVVEQILKIPVPRFTEDNAEVLRIIPDERISECAADQTQKVPVSRMPEETAEVASGSQCPNVVTTFARECRCGEVYI